MLVKQPRWLLSRLLNRSNEIETFCNISKSEGPKPHGPSEKKENIFFISKWTNPRFSLELYLILPRKSMEKAYFVHKHYFPMSLYSLLARISLGRREVLRLHGVSRQVRKGLEGEKKLEAIYPTTCNLGLIQFQTMDKWTEYVHKEQDLPINS